MYTYCPGCASIFRITSEIISVAGGQVRCGECSRVFNVVECLFDSAVAARHAALLNPGQGLPEQKPDEEAGPETAGPETAEAEASAPEEAAQDTPSWDAEVTLDEARETDAEEAEEARPVLKPLPAAGWAARGVRRGDMAGAAAVVLLMLLLGLQWTWFNREALARDASVRPLLERACELLSCRLPLQVDLARVEIVDRDVRQHPHSAEALLVNVTIANRADFPQPFPTFEISFSDIGGNPVAVRRFRPEEYLRGAAAAAAGMAVDVPMHIVLEVQDPGEKAVSFQFTFL